MPNDSENWTADQLRLMRWLALPKAERQPKTQRDLATQIGVHQDTVTDWKNLPGFRASVNQLAREFVQDDVPEVLSVIRREAKKGSLPYVQMVLAMAGMTADAQAPNVAPVIKVYAGFDPADV